jgi:hypothetical protein
VLPIVTNTTSIGDAPAPDALMFSILVTVLLLILVVLREFLDAAGAIHH